MSALRNDDGTVGIWIYNNEIISTYKVKVVDVVKDRRQTERDNGRMSNALREDAQS